MSNIIRTLRWTVSIYDFRFIVNKNGDAEEPVILKGVHPLLDAEALRVVSRLKGFTPGSQGGTPVDVYYMVPVTFSLAAPQPLLSKTSESGLLKYVAMNTGYPQEAKAASDTGRIYVPSLTVKWY